MSTTSRKLSKSTQAAYWLREQPSATLAEAGERFGISRQAVEQAWKALRFGETPCRAAYETNRDKAIELARGGKRCAGIASELGVSYTAVWHWLTRAGIPCERERSYSAQQFAAAVEYVKNGGTIGQAALLLGVTHGHMARLLKDRGLNPGKKGLRPGSRGGGRHGLSKVASDLMDRDGITAFAAATRVGVAYGSVRTYRLRRGLSV